MKLHNIASILLLAALFFGCSSIVDKDVSGYRSAEGLAELIESGEPYLLIDVRTAEEYKDGYIPSAQNIPHGEIVEGLQALGAAKDDVIILYCRSGMRSERAYSSLLQEGYINIVNFGGVLDWPGELEYPAE